MNNQWLALGIEQIDTTKFMDVQNQMFIKPEGGLWSSPYYPDAENKSEWQRFAKGWTTVQDLIDLMDKYKLEDAITQTLAIIDYEVMSKDYDGIYMTREGEADTRFSNPSLYGWDVESLLLFNLDCIESSESVTL